MRRLSNNQRIFTLPDLAATEALAQRLGRLLRQGDVIALHGELGAGKTALARALIQGLQAPLGIVEDVPSPTFTLVQQYEIGALSLWHFDLYRLTRPDEAYELGIEEAFSGGAALIEWPERLGALLPAARLDIYLATPENAGFDDTARTARLEWAENWADRMAHV